MNKYFCASYCNHPHHKGSGYPLNHECHILPPEAIEMEFMGEYERAAELIQAAKPLKVSQGTRCRHKWHVKKEWGITGHCTILGEHCLHCGKARGT